ncbi:hypothetical protein MTO96_015036 [Rhipicephalus appendiculatus]
MDHHCPWFNNCVCFSTYKFFLLTIFYVIVLSVFGLLSATHHVAGVWTNHAASDVTLHASFLYVFGVVLSLSLGSFLYFHITMVCSNVTTLEDLRPHQFKDKRDSFDVGLCNNIAEVFGHRKALWFPPGLHGARRRDPVPDTTAPGPERLPTRMPPVVGPPSCRYPVPSSESVALTSSTPPPRPPRHPGRRARLPPLAITIVPSSETPASQLRSMDKKDVTTSVVPPTTMSSAEVR